MVVIAMRENEETTEVKTMWWWCLRVVMAVACRRWWWCVARISCGRSRRTRLHDVDQHGEVEWHSLHDHLKRQ